MNAIEQTLRAQKERQELAARRAKMAIRETKAEQDYEKMLTRWEKGCIVRDKRTGNRYQYQGNVNDLDGTRS